MTENSWLLHDDAKVPKTLAPYENTLLDCLAEAAVQHPNAPAIWFKGNTLSWRELDTLSTQFAHALRDLRVAPGDVVASMTANAPQAVIVQLGAWKAGAIYAPLNPLYTSRELTDQLALTEARVIVVLTPFYKHVKTVQANTRVEHVIATRIREHLSPITKLVFMALREQKNGHRVRIEKNDLWLQRLLAAHAGKPPLANTITPDNDAILLSTGGTTGTPKFAVGSHRGIYAAARQIHTWLAEALPTPTNTLCLPLPLFHVFGNVGALGVSLYGHHQLALIPDPRNVTDVAATVNKTRPALFIGVPTLYNALLNHAKNHKVDFSSVKASISGAAPLSAEIKRAFEAATGGHLIEGYSLTEAMMACCINPLGGATKPGSVGLPLPDVHVRIVDPDANEHELSAHEVGEVLVHAPQIIQSYWKDEQSQLQQTRTADGKNWLHTGDLGYLDEDGFLFIVDRKKDLIKPSGFQVWPREVEDVIHEHPAVREVAVAGVPDTRRGEAVAAWIVLHPGATLTSENLRAYCKARLANYKVPTIISFRESLPKSTVGKVLRRELTREYRQNLADETS